MRDIFTELAPLADDIWFWAMTVFKGTKIFIPTAAQRNLIYVDIDAQLGDETLAFKNVSQGKNDIQLRQILEHYPALFEKLIREVAESKPYLSVILSVSDANAIAASIKNFFLQSFPDFELIIINRGSPINMPSLPTNFHIINYPGGSFGGALNLGLQKAMGDYVLFTNENYIFPREALEIVAKASDDSKADVIHFAGHIRLADRTFVLDDAPELRRPNSTFLDVPKQFRAALWLQNKLSRRLDMKTFKREFLLKHEIKFDSDLNEFVFQALIHADKYLIAPSAFCFCK